MKVKIYTHRMIRNHHLWHRELYPYLFSEGVAMCIQSDGEHRRVLVFTERGTPSQ